MAKYHQSKSSPSIQTLRKLCRPQGRVNNLLFFLTVVFMLLYLHDHSKLARIERKSAAPSLEDGQHRRDMDSRRDRLRTLCNQYGDTMRAEHGSIYNRLEPINKCTGTYFNVHSKDYFICNVLKGGSTSWRFFFGENNITSSLMADWPEVSSVS